MVTVYAFYESVLLTRRIDVLNQAIIERIHILSSKILKDTRKKIEISVARDIYHLAGRMLMVIVK
jgi:hypothetical protein